jgi:hypothetical protein
MSLSEGDPDRSQHRQQRVPRRREDRKDDDRARGPKTEAQHRREELEEEARARRPAGEGFKQAIAQTNEQVGGRQHQQGVENVSAREPRQNFDRAFRR